MEVRPGYKRTDAGVIPIEWNVQRLADISPKLSVGLVINPSTYFDVNGTVPMLVGSNVKENKIDWEGARRITESSNCRLPASVLRAGDLVTVRVGDPGTTAVVPEEHAGSNCASMMIIRGHSSFDSSWLCQLMNSRYGRAKIESVQYGTAQKQFNISDAVDFEFVVPPYSEQRAIATVLSDVDALIAGLERLIAKKRDIKQAAMQQLLTGKTRLPGFSGEWARTELKCLVSTPVTDGPHMTPKFYDSGVPFLSVNNLVDNRIDLTDLRYISKDDDQVFARKCKPKVGDVLLGKAASVGKVAIVEEDFDFNIWSPIALVRAGEVVHPKFLYYQLLSADCIGQIALLTNSSSQGNIGMGDIEKLRISYPRRDEQAAIAAVLSDMDVDLSALQSRLVKTRALKQGMMQELLTGRTRLV